MGRLGRDKCRDLLVFWKLAWAVHQPWRRLLPKHGQKPLYKFRLGTINPGPSHVAEQLLVEVQSVLVMREPIAAIALNNVKRDFSRYRMPHCIDKEPNIFGWGSEWRIRSRRRDWLHHRSLQSCQMVYQDANLLVLSR
jgi:hypothetical protein